MTQGLARYAGLSVAAALVVFGLKLAAWRLTGSVGLLSDALETLTNLGGAVMALSMLRLAAQPPDDEHAYGHNKAEYFSSGFEGILIFAAAAAIAIEAIPRLLAPQPLSMPLPGLAIAALATLVNFAVARVLGAAARTHDSIALRADARHLMADVVTTVGVIAGVALTLLTGWLRLDALVALAVAVQVLWTGYGLVRESASGLMDTAWPASERQRLAGILDEFRGRAAPGEVEFHALRTRRSAARRFVNFHVLVPGRWSVKQAHDLAEEVEARIAVAIPNAVVFTHLEPSDDPVSYRDLDLDRPDAGSHG